MTKTCALLIIDMINDFQFPQGETLADFTKKIVPPILQLKDHFHAKEWPVIYTKKYDCIGRRKVQ